MKERELMGYGHPDAVSILDQAKLLASLNCPIVIDFCKYDYTIQFINTLINHVYADISLKTSIYLQLVTPLKNSFLDLSKTSINDILSINFVIPHIRSEYPFTFNDGMMHDEDTVLTYDMIVKYRGKLDAKSAG